MHRPASHRLPRTGVWLLTLLAILSDPGAARAGADLNQEIAKVAEQIKLLLDEKGQDAIAVGDFRGPAKHPNYTHRIVGGKQSLTVPGWHRSNRASDSFKITEYARSAAAEGPTGSASIGTITAGFAAAWPPGAPPPADEASARKGARSGDATGKGPPVETNFTELAREVGVLRASVSVRYDKDMDPKDLPSSRP